MSASAINYIWTMGDVDMINMQISPVSVPIFTGDIIKWICLKLLHAEILKYLWQFF
jgi:hypothetical protein